MKYIKCPNCGKKLKVKENKADCVDCKVKIVLEEKERQDDIIIITKVFAYD